MQKCTLVKVEASANRWDKDSAQVGLMHTNGNVYTGGSYDNYRYYNIGEVSEGDVLTTYQKYTDSDPINTYAVSRIVAFDSSNNPLSSLGASSVSSYTVHLV